MSDGTVLNPGAGGDIIDTEQVGSVKIPRSKVVLGDRDVDGGDVSSTNPLPVSGTLTVVQATAANLQAQVTGSVSITGTPTVTANVGTAGGLALDATLTGGSLKAQVSDGTHQAALANADPSSNAYGLVVRNLPGNSVQNVAGTVTANLGTVAGLALDATLQSGAQVSKLSDGSHTAALANSTPAGTEYALITRNIPSGTQTVTVSGAPTVKVSDGTNNAAILNTGPTGNEYALVVRPVGSLTIGGNIYAIPSDGTRNLSKLIDLDNGGTTHEFALGVGLRQSASGGSVEVGTSAHPLRIDPTGSTVQPISGTITANVGTTGGIALDTTLTGGSLKAQVSDGTHQAAVMNSDPTGTEYGLVVRPLGVTEIAGSVDCLLTDGSGKTLTKLVDLDTSGSTHEYTLGIGLRQSGIGGSVEMGNSTHPLRIDPTGTTTQPVSLASAVTVQQSTASSLNATVSQATAANLLAQVSQPTAANLNATVVQSSAANLNATVTGSGTFLSRPTDGTNPISKTFDIDTSGTTHEYAQGVSLRQSASGGSVEAGTSAHPLRIDPTGSTTQPVSIGAAVTVQQSTASSLNAQVSQPTAANLNATVVQSSAANLNATVTGSGTFLSRPTDGTNPITKTIDLDTSGSTHDYQLGVNLRTTASGGSVEAATSAHPLRIDPTGTTTQPVSIGSAVTVQQSTASSLNATVQGSGVFLTRQTDGSNNLSKLVDLDTSGTTHEYMVGVGLRQSASGGSVEVGTSAHPLRIDTTGTTTQPVSGTVTATQGTAASASGAWPVQFTTGSTLVTAADSANNALRVSIVSGGGSGGTSLADKGTFTLGTTAITPVGGVFDDSPPSALTTDQAAAARMTAYRALHVNLRDSSGNAITGTAGTPAAPTLSVQGVSGGQALPVTGSVSISGTPTVAIAANQVIGLSSGLPDVASSGVITAGGQSVVLALSGYSHAGFYLSGTWNATVIFEVAFDGGTNYYGTFAAGTNNPGPNNFVTGVTTNGTYSLYIPNGASHVRIRANPFTSGSISVVIRATVAGDNHQLSEALTGDTVPLHATMIGGPDGSSLFRAPVVKNSSPVSGDYGLGVRTIGSVTVVGDVASGSADSGNPLKQGAVARTSEATAVSNGQRVNLVADAVGKQIVLPYSNPENFLDGTAAVTTTSSTNVIAAQGSGVRIYVNQITVFNSSATSTYVNIQDGNGGTTRYVCPAPANGGSIINFPTPIRLTANNALAFAAGSGVTTMYLSAAGYAGV